MQYGVSEASNFFLFFLEREGKNAIPSEPFVIFSIVIIVFLFMVLCIIIHSDYTAHSVILAAHKPLPFSLPFPFLCCVNIFAIFALPFSVCFSSYTIRLSAPYYMVLALLFASHYYAIYTVQVLFIYPNLYTSFP